jgi:hypothetical protein
MIKVGDVVKPFMQTPAGIKTYRDEYLYVAVEDYGHSFLLTNGKEFCCVPKGRVEKFIYVHEERPMDKYFKK